MIFADAVATAAGRLGERGALAALLLGTAVPVGLGVAVPLLPWQLLCLSVLPVVPLLGVVLLRRRRLVVVQAAGCAGAAVLVLQLGLGGASLAVVLWMQVLVVGLPASVLSVLRSRLDALRARAEHSARTDALTGLLDRHGMAEDVPGAVAAAAAAGDRLGVLVLDVDRFRSVNDAFGHSTGDLLLQAVAGVVRADLRQCDVVVRWGGDELAVVTHASDDEALRAVAERLRRRVAGLLVPGLPPVTASVGLASAPPDAARAAAATGPDGSPRAARDLVSQLLDRAQGALHEAGRTGRDRVVQHGGGAPRAVVPAPRGAVLA